MSTKEIKGNLARLLATENLVVEHKTTETAYFNVDTRVLVLPKWDKASDVVYDMLVGHEVGHALFTPNVDWTQDYDIPKDYINVIEDARIEKLMKRKYPGLKKSFTGGYAELNDKDFFQILDTDLSELTLIDRINLHFKLGAHAMLPFEGAEYVFVARADLAETFDEVLKIAQDVYDYCKTQEDNKKTTEVPVAVPPSSTGGDTSQDDESFGSIETNKIKGEQSSGSELEDVEDDWYDEDGDLTDEEEDRQAEGGIHGSATQQALESSKEKLSSEESYGDRPTTYVEIPKTVNTKDYVVDWKVLHDWIDSQKDSSCDTTEIDEDYRKFRKQSQKEVNYLVKEFECRKSADAYARAGTAKTGVLNTGLLHTYKYNEDLFKRITVVPDGKNHGLLFLLDWSGSMSRELLATVKQLLNLTSFCKKVQIPFEVYAFTNEWALAQRAIDNDSRVDDQSYYRYRAYEKEDMVKNEIYLDKGYFYLMNFVSSRSNSKDYERMCLQLFREASYYDPHTRYYGYTSFQNTPGVGLSGTPLNEAIIMLNYILPKFKKNNDLQKVNICVLTDGESCSTQYGREYTAKNYETGEEETRISSGRIDWGIILRDRKTGIVYRQFTYGDTTNIFIQQLKDRNPDVNVLGFRILSGGQLSNYVCTYGGGMEYYPTIQKQWRKEKSAIIPNPIAYSALYAINNNAIDADTSFEVNSDRKADISRAFKKMLSNKSVNKKLLNSFISMVA